METHELSVQGLKKRFGRKTAVVDVSLAVRSGEIIGLLGPNGAGKTTVFYMTVGFIKPSAGDILLDGRSVSGLPMYKRARRGISYLPQEPSIFRRLTVEKNVMAVLETRRDLSHKEKRHRLDQLLEEFGLGELRRQQAYTLSGGERRRTEIARALAIEPKFLLLDEPFAGIDPKSVSEIKGIIGRLSEKGIGVLITDHNAYDLLNIITFGYVIAAGSVAFTGRPREIASSDLVRQVYLGSEFNLIGPVDLGEAPASVPPSEEGGTSAEFPGVSASSDAADDALDGIDARLDAFEMSVALEASAPPLDSLDEALGLKKDDGRGGGEA
jgi:lipopolysaccharide export system ATP-binding protein